MPITEEIAKDLIENLLYLQENPDKSHLVPCPRCGAKMHEDMMHNRLSRRANIFICQDCGEEEEVVESNQHVVRDLLFIEWAMFNGYERKRAWIRE